MATIEGSHRVGNAESSDETDKDKKKDDKAANGRWIKPPLPREGVSFNQRRPAELPVRPPLPLEKIINPAEEKDDDEEDEDEEEEGSPEAAAAEAVDAPDQGNETVEHPSDEVFETMAVGDTATDAELMDIPHVDADKPGATPTFEEILAREMPPDFAEATSGPELGSPDEPDIPPIPSWDMPTTEHPLGAGEAAPPEPTAATPPEPPKPTAAPSFWRPSPSPSPAPFEAGGYSAPAPGRTEASPAAPSFGGEIVSAGFDAALEALKSLTDLSELINDPNRLAVQFLTKVALEGFFAQRKQEQYNNEPMLQQQREEIARLHDEQRKTNELLTSNARRNVLAPNEQLEIFDQAGNRVVLQPGWQVKRSPAGYSFVVDRHNRVVHDAIHYGKAFAREQRREHLSDDAFAAFGAGGSVVPGAQDNGGPAAPFPPDAGQAQSTQAGGQYALPDHQVDINHRLPEPRNYLKGAITSPWLWTGIAVLIIIYFVAALA